MASLQSLPVELLTVLLSHLPGRDVASVSCCCKRLRETARIESVWQKRCQIEYGISDITSTRGVTYYELYTQILYKNGELLGMWQADVEPYGGLVRVQFNGDRLEGIQCHAPPDPHAAKPLRMRLIFTVELDENRKGSVLCHSRHCSPHPGELYQIMGDADVFSCKCSQPEMHQHPEGEEAEFSEWMSLQLSNEFYELDNEYFTAEFRTKFYIIRQFETKSSYTRLQLSISDTSVFEIIPPGIFKGSYEAHGVELLSLSYDDEHKNLTLRKISGDENVPAGKVSFRADLTCPMILSEEQQESLQALIDIDPQDIPEDVPIDQLPIQPFHIPSDCEEFEQYKDLPKTCKARFHSQAQLAQDGFINPWWIGGHLVVFDDNTFGKFWLDLSSFTLFSRIMDISKTITIDATMA